VAGRIWHLQYRRNCVSSNNPSDNGYWFGFVTTYLQTNGVDWCYWPINGTESTGRGRTYGARETYGVLNTSWDGSARPALTARLRSLIGAASKENSIPRNSSHHAAGKLK